jgi:hypothetical protein
VSTCERVCVCVCLYVCVVGPHSRLHDGCLAPDVAVRQEGLSSAQPMNVRIDNIVGDVDVAMEDGKMCGCMCVCLWACLCLCMCLCLCLFVQPMNVCIDNIVGDVDVAMEDGKMCVCVSINLSVCVCVSVFLSVRAAHERAHRLHRQRR